MVNAPNTLPGLARKCVLVTGGCQQDLHLPMPVHVELPYIGGRQLCCMLPMLLLTGRLQNP